MSALRLLVIADPAAPFLKTLSRLPPEVPWTVCGDPARLPQEAAKADAILFASRPALLTAVLPVAPQVRWIHCLWTGVEGLIGPELRAHPAPLTNGKGVFGRPLADWVAAAMLFFAFDLRRVLRQQEAGVWEQFSGTSLYGRTLGIVGYGGIGSAAAERARAFGMKIAALRRHSDLLQGVDHAYVPARLREMMTASDYVLAAAPLTPETRGLIGEAEIAAMKPSAVIINVGRGPVIDEAALIRALDSGQIRGAALDVFDTEPLPAGHPFYRMSNVLLSPHTADRVEGFLDPAFDCFFDNLERFLKGQPLLNLVDKNAGY